MAHDCTDLPDCVVCMGEYTEEEYQQIVDDWICEACYCRNCLWECFEKNPGYGLMDMPRCQCDDCKKEIAEEEEEEVPS